MEGVPSARDPRCGAYTLMAVYIVPHENIERGGLNRTGELLRGFRRINREGERKDQYTNVFVGALIIGRVLGGAGRGNGVDRGCFGVVNVRRHQHGAGIGHGQSARKIGRGGSITQRSAQLPLAAFASDLCNGGALAVDSARPGIAGSVDVSPLVESVTSAVTRAVSFLFTAHLPAWSVAPSVATVSSGVTIATAWLLVAPVVWTPVEYVAY